MRIPHPHILPTKRSRFATSRATAALALFLAVIVLSTVPAHAIFLTWFQESQKNDTPFYDPTAGCSNTNANAGTGTGTLPKLIPDPYNSAFTHGGNKHKVSPALVAALFTEENFTHSPTADLPKIWAGFPKRHPDPNSGWPTNSYGTEGAFQFLAGTWAAYGDDGNGDGKKDPQNIWDGAAAAANYVAANGATVNKPPSSWQRAIFAYNHAQWYVDAVMMYYNYYNSGGTVSSSSGTTPGAPANAATSGTDTSSCDSSAVGAGSCTKTPAGNLSALRANIVACAQNELSLWKTHKMNPGFRSGSADSYAKYSYNHDELWCADFASWIFLQVGYPLDGQLSRKPSDMAFVPNIAAMGLNDQQKGVNGGPNQTQAGSGKFAWHAAGSGYKPQPGDMAIHSNEGHVNIIIDAKGNMIGGDQGGEDHDTNVVSQDPAGLQTDGWVVPTGK